jgi:hypothetical protein
MRVQKEKNQPTPTRAPIPNSRREDKTEKKNSGKNNGPTKTGPERMKEKPSTLTQAVSGRSNTPVGRTRVEGEMDPSIRFGKKTSLYYEKKKGLGREASKGQREHAPSRTDSTDSSVDVEG